MIAGDCNVIPHKILWTHINSKFFIKWFFLVCGLEMWGCPVGVDNNGIVTNYQEGGYCKNIISVFGGSEETKVIGGETQQQRDVTKGKAITCVLSIIFNHRCRGFRSPSLKTMAFLLQFFFSLGSRGGLPKKYATEAAARWRKRVPLWWTAGKTWLDS